MKRFTYLLLFHSICTTVPALPQYAETPKFTIDGTVVEWIWRASIDYRVHTEGRGKRYTIPAHYLLIVRLKKFDAELVKELEFTKHIPELRHPMMERDLKESEVFVWIPSLRLLGLREEANIEISEYLFWHDENSSGGKYSDLKIDGKKPTFAPLLPLLDEDR